MSLDGSGLTSGAVGQNAQRRTDAHLSELTGVFGRDHAWARSLPDRVLGATKLGIKVLIVEPGPFRTDWAGRSAGEVGNPISDYADTAGALRKAIRGYSGQQPGDPARAAQAIDKAVNSSNPPLRLLLGKAALQGAREKIGEMTKDFDAWAQVTEGADFPDQG